MAYLTWIPLKLVFYQECIFCGNDCHQIKGHLHKMSYESSKKWVLAVDFFLCCFLTSQGISSQRINCSVKWRNISKLFENRYLLCMSIFLFTCFILLRFITISMMKLRPADNTGGAVTDPVELANHTSATWNGQWTEPRQRTTHGGRSIREHAAGHTQKLKNQRTMAKRSQRKRNQRVIKRSKVSSLTSTSPCV